MADDTPVRIKTTFGHTLENPSPHFHLLFLSLYSVAAEE
jgi:hypothetical protein